MRASIAIAGLALALAACIGTVDPVRDPVPPRAGASDAPAWGLVIHGGAGVITRASLSAEREAAARGALEQALRAGHAVLARGGSSLDAVTAAVVVLEDSPLFNAGKGAVFTHDGRNELDAAIMNGRTLAAGAVAGLTRVKNPVLLARRVMERSRHVMMIGAGAEVFAEQQGLELVEPSYFYTEDRWKALQRALEAERDAGTALDGGPRSHFEPTSDAKLGTVGAVAMDRQGDLAAGTSTGGLTNKRFGRVGDVPIIGAGTYASPDCAVSATGQGEYFIRYTVAHDICARAKYQGVPVADAARTVVKDVLVRAGGEGGVIAMDGRGTPTMVFNSAGMYRGYIGADGTPQVAIYER
jgi:beta-aspartyl-peptidase (threonine type)